MRRRYVYDSGALIAIDQGNATALRRHETRLNELDQVIMPAPVAAQVVRDPRRQARLMLTLRGCDVVPFAPDQVAPVGTLLAGAGTADGLDGLVAVAPAPADAAAGYPGGRGIPPPAQAP